SILYGILYHIEYENRFYTFAFFFFAKVIKNASPKGEGFHPSQNYKLKNCQSLPVGLPTNMAPARSTTMVTIGGLPFLMAKE
ncbi:MAG TPA: hypothetical protein VIO15_03505, partial [Bacteroidales bacterium]